MPHLTGHYEGPGCDAHRADVSDAADDQCSHASKGRGQVRTGAATGRGCVGAPAAASSTPQAGWAGHLALQRGDTSRGFRVQPRVEMPC
jgi:hypothetical protein